MQTIFPGETIKLLIVDDDPMMRILVKGHLEDENYDIDEAADGLEALDMLDRVEYDLAIVDLYMPGMSGEALLEKVRRKDKFIGLVVCSSETDVKVSFRLLEQHDISDYLTKPIFSETQLKFSIRNAVSRRKFLRQQDSHIRSLEQLKLQAEEAKTYFLTQMSHELNTPMNVILGFSQLLESMDEGMDDKQKSYIKHIVKAGWTLMDMIDKILKFSSIEFDVLDLKNMPVSVDDLCRDVIETLQPEAKRAGILVSLNDRELAVLADLVQLRAVLHSLVSNAILYNKENGQVIIDSEVLDDRYVRISVRDTGRGIPSDKLNDLFTPFNRLGVELQTISGAGLSLALSKRLVDAMAGQIYCSSEHEVGSTFFIELPKADINDIHSPYDSSE